jgi:hypothetical protein
MLFIMLCLCIYLLMVCLCIKLEMKVHAFDGSLNLIDCAFDDDDGLA